MTDLNNIDIRNKEAIYQYEHERLKIIFEYLPVAIWEEDCSALADLKKQLDAQGIADYQKHLTENPDLIKEVFGKFEVIDVNREALRLYGVDTKSELINNVGKDFHESLIPILIEEFSALMSGNEDFSIEFKSQRVKGKADTEVLMRASVPAMYRDTFKRVIITFQDITERKKMEHYLEELSYTDGLTGILNQRAILKQLETEYVRARRYNLDFSVLMLDLDHFKPVNDQYGHQKGDFIIKTAAEIIKNHIREVDIAGRYGGDEFLVLLPETPPECAEIVAIRLLNKAREIFSDKNVSPIEVTFSIGVGYCPRDDVKNAKHLLANADAALYMSKRQGRNRITVA